jgi:SAM-dependent methyltransferase
MDWFHRQYEGWELFADPEEEKAYRDKQGAITRPEIEAYLRFLELKPGARVLDVFCGNGRHAVGLAQRGVKVGGVDTSFSRIAFASRWSRDERVEANFLVGDAKTIPVNSSFNTVVILGGSFTYFPGEEENISLLQRLRAILRPSGSLLIDNPNPLRFWRIRHPEGTLTDQSKVSYFDFPLGRGETFGYVRYHGKELMETLFKKAALKVWGVFGDREGGPYSFDSPRMIIIGRPNS